jgi:hypothetical protein
MHASKHIYAKTSPGLTLATLTDGHPPATWWRHIPEVPVPNVSPADLQSKIADLSVLMADPQAYILLHPNLPLGLA